MNRIDSELLPSLLSKTPGDSPPSTTVESGRLLCNPQGAHSLFVPEHYEEGYAYPLLLWLHGNHGDERQLLKIIPSVSLRNYVAVAPRGTLPAWQTAEQDGSRRSSYRWVQNAEAIVETQERVHECIAAARQRFNIAKRRIFIAGADSGGTMAIRLALSEPDCFAGAASLGGPFPDSLQPLRRINEIRHFPLLIAAARDSRNYPEGRLCHDLRLAHAAGLSLSLRQYVGEDGLTPAMLSDLNHWVMTLVCER